MCTAGLGAGLPINEDHIRGEIIRPDMRGVPIASLDGPMIESRGGEQHHLPLGGFDNVSDVRGHARTAGQNPEIDRLQVGEETGVYTLLPVFLRRPSPSVSLLAGHIAFGSASGPFRLLLLALLRSAPGTDQRRPDLDFFGKQRLSADLALRNNSAHVTPPFF